MSATKTEYKAFIGGEWADSVSGETMEVINPATGDVIAEVPRCNAADVDARSEAAKQALPTGSTRRRRTAPSCSTSWLTCSNRTPRSSLSSSRSTSASR